MNVCDCMVTKIKFGVKVLDANIAIVAEPLPKSTFRDKITLTRNDPK